MQMLVRLRNKLLQNPKEVGKSKRPKTLRWVGFSSMIYIQVIKHNSRMSHTVLSRIQLLSLQVLQMSNHTWILLRLRESDVPLSSKYHLEGKIWNYYVCMFHSPHLSACANITLFSWHGYHQFAIFPPSSSLIWWSPQKPMSSVRAARLYTNSNQPDI